MWCPGCLISKGIWNDIKKIYPNFEYINYDYDLDEEKIEKYNVKDIVPVVIFEKDNIEIKRIIGEKSKDEILKDDISNGVPYTVIGEKYFVGFSDTIKEKMETEINNLINNISEDKDSVKIPLLGKVTAGTPIEAIETPDEYFALPVNLINPKKETFTLKVSGESMINIGIYDGDILIVERQNTANNGDTVVAMNSDNEATVKTFYKENGYFRSKQFKENIHYQVWRKSGSGFV